MKTLTIDCSQGEGGGQILRTALSLAAIERKPVQLENIRAKRPKKGLMAQHLTAVQTLKQICNAETKGDKLFSEKLYFKPGKISGGQFTTNIGTAGSITLLLQTILPCCLFAHEKISLRCVGGTDVAWSPPAEFIQEVLFPVLNAVGASFSSDLIKRGYYPRGQGIIVFESKPAKLPLKPVNLTEKGKLKFVKLFSHCASLPKEVALNQAKAAKQKLAKELGEIEFEEKIECQEKTNTIGSGIDLVAVYEKARLHGSALGKRGKPAFAVGQEAVENLNKELKPGKACDSNLADQLIPFMALAAGESIIETTRLSSHCLTNINVTEQMLNVKFKVESEHNQPARISVQGLGLKFWAKN